MQAGSGRTEKGDGQIRPQPERRPARAGLRRLSLRRCPPIRRKDGGDRMIRDLFILFGASLVVITLPGSIELLLLTVAGILPRRRSNYHEAASRYRLAVVVPAHN